MALGAAALAMAGCIKNDLPYPRVPVAFTDFMVEGQSEPAVIDPDTRTITLTMGEEADLESVELLDFSIEPSEGRVDELEIGDKLNLVRPVYLTASLYQQYVWTVRATQTIERYISVEPQMGDPVIDVPGRRIIVYVPSSADMTKIKVVSLKLAAPSATMEPDLRGREVDMTKPVDVIVSDHGRESLWTIYCEPVDATVTLDRIDAWTRVAWLYGSAEEGKDNGFEYRIEGTQEWTRVPQEWITSGAGTMSCRLIHLSPSTTYEVRAYSDMDATATELFTTGEEAQLPNGDFDLWWLDGKVWNPWAEGGTPFWDTGNKGATTLGSSNTQPTADTQTGTGYAAELKSEFKGVGSLGKLAAGNIFTGVYVRTDGTNGILSFGREFSRRPTRLSAMFKYKSAAITHVGSDTRFKDWKGRPDTAMVYIALTDWPSPMEVRTNPRNQNLFDPADPGVIAYGYVQYGEDVSTWTPLSIELEYRSTSRVPKYVLVVCSASKYGDFFVGGSGSILTIDDLKLEYDY